MKSENFLPNLWARITDCCHSLFILVALTAVSCISIENVKPLMTDNVIMVQPMMPGSTKAPIEGTTFPDQAFVMSASYTPTGGSASTYFQGINFSKSGSVWVPSTSKYWPKSSTTAFLAASFPGLSATTYWGSPAASSMTLASSGNANTIPDNRTVQSDIMYAGTGNVTQSSGSVALQFKHALALLKFTGQAYTSYNSSSNTGVTIESIVINSLKYQGKLGVTLTGNAVSASWTLQSATGSATAASGSWGLPQSGTVDIGNGYMVIPQTAVSFTINYTFHKGSSNVSKSYTYTPSGSWSMGQAYKYNIYIDKDETEIRVAPSLTDWSNAGTSPVDIVNEQLAYATFGGLMISPAPAYYDGSVKISEDSYWNHDSYGVSQTYYNHSHPWASYMPAGGASFGGYNDWRIPSADEMSIILGSGRSGSSVNGISGVKYSLIQLTGVTHAGTSTPIGLLIFPDDLVITGKALSGTNGTTLTTGFTSDELDQYLRQGCVFFPASGSMYSWGWGDGGTVGRYATNTYKYDKNYDRVYSFLNVSSGHVGINTAIDETYCLSLRLIRTK